MKTKPTPRKLYVPSNLDMADRHREPTKREDLGFATFSRDAVRGPTPKKQGAKPGTQEEGHDRG